MHTYVQAHTCMIICLLEVFYYIPHFLLLLLLPFPAVYSAMVGEGYVVTAFVVHISFNVLFAIIAALFVVIEVSALCIQPYVCTCACHTQEPILNLSVICN